MTEEIRVSELGNNKVMKQLLDEEFSKCLTKRNIKPDHLFNNSQIIVMTVCSIFALLSHFNGMTWPDSKWVVAICSVSYFITYVIGEIIAHYTYANVFFAGQPADTPLHSHMNKIFVTSQLDRFDSVYHLSVYTTHKGKKISYAMNNSVGRYFQEDGLLVQNQVKEDTDELMNNFVELFNKKGKAKKND
ncbi:hypothetical protein WA158_001637 [Blastocystis sp. Blastoise]